MKLLHTIAALTAPVLVFSAPLPIGKDKTVPDLYGISPEIDELLCNPNRRKPLNMVYPYSWLIHRCYHPPEWYPNWNKIQPEDNGGLQGTAGATSEEVVNTPRSVMSTEDVPEVTEPEGPEEKEKTVGHTVPPSCIDDYCRSGWCRFWYWGYLCKGPYLESRHRGLPIGSENNGDLYETTAMTPGQVVDTPGPVMPTENVPEVMESGDRPQEMEKRSKDDILPLSLGSDSLRPSGDYWIWEYLMSMRPECSDPQWRVKNCPPESPCPALKDCYNIGQAVDVTPEEVVDTPGPVVPMEKTSEVTAIEGSQEIEKRSNDVAHTPPVPDLSWPRPPVPQSFWAKMRDYFSKIEPGKIDLKELEKKYGYRHVHSWGKWDLFDWSKGGNAGAN